LVNPPKIPKEEERKIKRRNPERRLRSSSQGHLSAAPSEIQNGPSASGSPPPFIHLFAAAPLPPVYVKSNDKEKR
jgi:hypothetical protein